ncbi:MAG: hypothetical protein K0R00_1288 [Herbinix sp.]|nr:hypothetical protein [Herbinix sp.]
MYKSDIYQRTGLIPVNVQKPNIPKNWVDTSKRTKASIPKNWIDISKCTKSNEYKRS